MSVIPAEAVARVDSDRPSPLDQGYRIDRYELLYALAQGGMGSVWVARMQGKHGFEKLFAIKTILPQHAGDPHFRTMFLDEARVASAIVHPNVGQILDLGEHQGILYLVMEWVEGDSLDRLIRNAEKAGRMLPIGFVMRVVAETCLGLHAAHELTDREGKSFEVVHRDISPQNILVALNGCPKVIDFGVAKARDRMSGETSGVVIKGKLRYIAPQQALGLSIDRRADIWSMGAVLYMAFVGETPYPGDNELEVLRALLSGAPPALLPTSVPRPISRVIETCLQHAPSARYPTALALHRAIEEAMIEASTPCSVAEVGAYMQEHTQHRVESRRHALETALAVIAERRGPARVGVPSPLELTPVEHSLIPVDLASYSKDETFRAPRPIGHIVVRAVIVLGVIVLLGAVAIFAVVSSSAPKKIDRPVSAAIPLPAESAAVPILSRPVPSASPSVAATATHRRAHPKSPQTAPSNGLGSAIDSRK